MPFYSLTIKNRERPLKNILAQYIIILMGTLILAGLTYPAWAGYTALIHTILEIACVFIAISSFLTVWHNYHRNPPVNHLIGFGLLCTAVFDLFHTFYFPFLNLYPQGYFDLSTRYWVLGRLTEAAVLLVCSTNLFQPRIKNWFGLIFSAGLTLGISYLVLHFPGLMPVLLTEQGPTPLKIALEYLIVGLYLASLYQLKNRVNSRDILTYRYIFLALIIAVPAELCFTLFDTLTSFYTSLGHILKITCYYYLYRGIFVSAVTYPYERLEEAGRYTAAILNGLPIGLLTYDNNLRVSFINRKALDLSGIKKEEEVIGLRADDLMERYWGPEEIGNPLTLEPGKTSCPVKNRIMTIKKTGLKIII
ncbi:MAG: MASE3 domain-containing protein, partial [Bacillota bacterium]